MLARSHQVLGFTCGMLAVPLCQSFNIVPAHFFSSIIFMGTVLIGSLFPDIDSPTTKLGRKFWLLAIMLFAAIITIATEFPKLWDIIDEHVSGIGSMLLPMLLVFLGHRKFTHSLPFLGLLVIYGSILHTVYSIPMFYLVGFLIGNVAHFLGDFPTTKGIPLLYPFSKKYFRAPLVFDVGSPIEHIITLLLVGFNIVYISLYII
ncbi:metal-dependent hydrolase [Bacillus salitolerans]|uniref:Metal-dependent hydrolase n=1 Tax=Bacillus salitolerans TaxID=1437434 RepID=A0ABW4LM41_9BACI